MGSIIRSLSFLFLDDFKGNANISVAIRSGSTVLRYRALVVLKPVVPAGITELLGLQFFME